MNEQPKESKPSIPPGLLDKLDKHERWLYETVFDGVQKTDWLIAHAVEADKHRTYINAEVSRARAEILMLEKKVDPAINLAAKFSTLRGKSVAAGLAFITIAITVALTEWFKSFWKGTP